MYFVTIQLHHVKISAKSNRKPELIRTLFVISLGKGWRTDMSIKKIHESWNLNGNIFFELFLGDLDEKMTSAGYRRKRNKKESETVQRADNFQFVAFVNQIIKSLLLDNFSLRSQQMVPNYLLYSYKYPEFHLRKICPQFTLQAESRSIFLDTSGFV